MAEWFKAAVLKTVERKFRGFESYSLRQNRFQLRPLENESSLKIGAFFCLESDRVQ
jgi:hypothetical protein